MSIKEGFRRVQLALKPVVWEELDKQAKSCGMNITAYITMLIMNNKK